MVLLTTTPAIISAFAELQSISSKAEKADEQTDELPCVPRASLAVGDPVAHEQIVDTWKQLSARPNSTCRLEQLLRGSRIYIPPAAPKPEPTPEYKALMERLRREEEARAYQRMINPPPAPETFEQRFPGVAPFSFEAVASEEEDEVTYSDVNRQITVIFNVLISIVACAAALWTVARHWSTPLRLALSMTGSIIVGIAEVVVYTGYLRRVGESKSKEKKKQEVKEVINSWTIVADQQTHEKSATKVQNDEISGLRARKTKIPPHS